MLRSSNFEIKILCDRGSKIQTHCRPWYLQCIFCLNLIYASLFPCWLGPLNSHLFLCKVSTLGLDEFFFSQTTMQQCDGKPPQGKVHSSATNRSSGCPKLSHYLSTALCKIKLNLYRFIRSLRGHFNCRTFYFNQRQIH